MENFTKENKASLVSYVLGVAARSNVEKRQVGCLLLNRSGDVVGQGFNDEECHAETRAIDNWKASPVAGSQALKAIVTHPPCPECARALQLAGIQEVEVVEAFMKFDGDKPRYDLIPVQPIEDLAKVLTFGARKYKPNNWRECSDLGRYEAALFRHIQAHRSGEKLDPETQLPHLAHAMCNLVFLMELS